MEVVEFDVCFGKCVARFGRGCLGPATDVAASIKDGPRSPSSNFQLMMQGFEMCQDHTPVLCSRVGGLMIAFKVLLHERTSVVASYLV